MKKIFGRPMNWASLGILAVIVICVNIIASRLFVRLDLTDDSIYTLSEGTESILGKLDDEVVGKLFFSRSSKSLPPLIKTYATRVEEVLNEYASMSGGNFSFEIFDPKPDSDEEEVARKHGLQPVRTPSGEEIYFGLVLMQGKREINIPYLDPRREEFLEYDLSEAVLQVQQSDKPKIGLMSSLPVMAAGGGGNPFGGQQQESWAIVQQLQRNYEVQRIDVTVDTIPPDVNVLMVMHPKNFSDKALFAIDQFVMRGGRLFVAVDPFSRFDLASSGQMARMQGQMPQARSDLKKLFDAWGVEYDAGKIVGDFSHATQINAGRGPFSTPFFINGQGDFIRGDLVVTQKLKHIAIAEGGAFKVREDSGLKTNLLLATSSDSGFADGMMASFMRPEEFVRQLKKDEEEHTVAAILTGKFKSAFSSPPDGVNAAIKSESDGETSVFIVADVDFMADHNSVQVFRLGPQVIARPINDNLSFAMNVVEFLGGSSDLISIRSSGRISRPFTKVQELQRSAQERYQAEEERLSAKLKDTQEKLNRLQSQKTEGGRFFLSAEQQAEIEKFREEEVKIRRARRKVRESLREDIERLGVQIVTANMVGVPLLVAIFGGFVFVRRSRKQKRR